MNGPAIVVEDVAKRFRVYHERNQSLKIALMRGKRANYDEFWALQDIDLQIPQGKTFGLVGHNGSGKSTLLKCLAKILVPDRGRITANGKISALLELGAGFHAELSGRDNVYLNGSILGLTKRDIDARFDDIVGFAGLEQFIDSPVKNYSSGMYVRLGFSVAISVDPDILMVDEVLAVGDEEFQRRCMEKFQEFRDDGRTIVVVSHALGTMRSMCDEVAWLDHGRLLAVGSPSDIVDEYSGSSRHDQVAAADGDTGARWGTGELQVTGVELVHGGGVGGAVRTGEPATFRLTWAAHEPVAKPVFAIDIDTPEGVSVTSTATRDAGPVPDVLEGEGHVDLVVPRLPLLPGTYVVRSWASDVGGLHVYDQRDKVLRFDVAPAPGREQGGLVTLDGAWQPPMRPHAPGR
ncbi:ABC transporter ATP-binding protein [Cellulomonas aerilata]|uniref:ABC transporter n=1 Tax=Cellulomonas aerilata TaxID=515326 RepID=A0A512DE03_9CELL|nr:ABC transporter ATP-binding protein [Cellulomonas aerilata]GEO34460.1 ABC transporter [Cellulomonas aerilata]